MPTLASLTHALTLGLPYWAVSLLVLGFLVVCVVLILTVLIQRPQGGGLSGAFGAGGGGSGQTAFGTKTGDALTIATISLFIVFLLFGIGLNFAARPANLDSSPQPVVTPSDTDQTGAGPETAAGADPGSDTPAEVPAEPTSDDAPAPDDADDAPNDGPTPPADQP